MANISLLGNKIEAARKEHKLSQAKLAELVGVSRASISLYETGEGAPSYKVLIKLSTILGLDLPVLSSLSESVDYNESMVTRKSFDEVNNIRSQLVREVLELEEKYIEVDFLSPRTVTADEAGNMSLNQGEVDKLRAEGIVDFTLGNDPTREIDINLKWATVSVLAIPGLDYSDASIFIVKDNKMGARYPESSRHVFHPIKVQKQWRYLTGLHGFFIKGSTVIIRRITVNKINHLELADDDGNVISVLWEDVTMVWKVGQAVHMPPEE
jgi:putative transcriptional regulator